MLEKVYCHIDVETSGLACPECGITSISGIICDHNNYILETFDFFMKPFPEDKIEPGALKVQNITLDELMKRPDPNVVYKKVKTILDKYVNRYAKLPPQKKKKYTFVAYNASFDSDHFRAWMEKCGDDYYRSYFRTPPLCTMQLAVANLSNYIHLLPNFKLGTVSKFAVSNVNKNNLHMSSEDVKLSKALFDKYYFEKKLHEAIETQELLESVLAK